MRRNPTRLRFLLAIYGVLSSPSACTSIDSVQYSDAIAEAREGEGERERERGRAAGQQTQNGGSSSYAGVRIAHAFLCKVLHGVVHRVHLAIAPFLLTFSFWFGRFSFLLDSGLDSQYIWIEGNGEIGKGVYIIDVPASKFRHNFKPVQTCLTIVTSRSERCIRMNTAIMGSAYLRIADHMCVKQVHSYFSQNWSTDCFMEILRSSTTHTSISFMSPKRTCLLWLMC